MENLAAESGKSILLPTHGIDVAVRLFGNMWLTNVESVQRGAGAVIIENGFLCNLQRR